MATDSVDVTNLDNMCPSAKRAGLGTLIGAGLAAAEVDVLDGVTAGTQAAGKAVVADANVNTGVSKITALHIGATGAETQVTSTAAELNILDGVTSTAAELNILDGVTSTAAELNILDGVTATAAELNNAADVSARTQALTTSGAITAGGQSVSLDHTTVAIAATIANANAHQGMFHVKAITEPGAGQDHTVTLTAGTWNGTNNVATFADINDALTVYFDASGNGTIINNTGTVALS